MKIQPYTYNSIDIELEDGSTFNLQDTEVDGEHRLYIKPLNNNTLVVSERNQLNWKPISRTKHNFMLTIVREKQNGQ